MAKIKKLDIAKKNDKPTNALSIEDFLKLIQKEVEETIEETDFGELEDEGTDDSEDDEESYLLGLTLPKHKFIGPMKQEFHIRIKLNNAPVNIWRELVVPSNITLEMLAYVLIDAMGWRHEHLYQYFGKNNICYMNSRELKHRNDSFFAFMSRVQYKNSEKTSLEMVLQPKGERLKFEYDFGDSWTHDLWVKGARNYAPNEEPIIKLLKAQGECPPEDCGGVWGYAELLELNKKKRKTAEEKERLEWYDIPKDFDPEVCDLEWLQDDVEALWMEIKEDSTCRAPWFQSGHNVLEESDAHDVYTDWDDADADSSSDESEYAYKHPDYPKTLEMENPWVGDVLCKPENALGLKPALVKRILALSAESLRKDLEHLIMYHVGLTCDEIPEEYDPGDRFNGVIGSSLVLLADVGNGESSLDVVLEVMRQSPDFSEYHICDLGEELFVPTICKLGQDHLDTLLAYAKEPGLYGYLQSVAFAAVRVMAFYNPHLRQPIVDWFRDLLSYYADYSQSHDVDRELMGLLVSEVVDLHAPELLPEVKALFDAGAVHEGTSGDYKSVVRDIKKRGFENPVTDYSFNAEARFKDICKLYKD